MTTEGDYRAWFEEAPGAAVIVDGAGTAVAWNGAARALLGTMGTTGATPDGGGRPWREVFPPAFHAGVAAAFAAGGGAFREEASGVAGTASPRPGGGWWVALRLSPPAPEEWAALLEEVPAAVFVARDAACREVTLNRFAAELLRRAPESGASGPVRFFRRGIELEEGEQPLQVAAARNIAVSGAEFDVDFGDGTARRVFGNAHPIRDAAGRSRGAVGVFVDITARLRGEREANRATALLEDRVRQRTAALLEANLELEEFCYSISHDLRTPLRTVAGMVELLRGWEASAAERDDYLSRLERASGRMDALIRGLLAYSHMGSPAWKEAGAEAAEIDLGELAAAVMEDLRFEHERLGVEARNEIPAGAGLTVRGHAVALQQALANLLENAVKFVAPGVKPRVRLFAEREEGLVRLGVIDNGIGVPDEYRGKIFGLFERLHGQDDYAGTGVGLSIARRAVERMGGRIGCSDAPQPPETGGPGSLFWVELPMPPRN